MRAHDALFSPAIALLLLLAAAATLRHAVAFVDVAPTVLLIATYASSVATKNAMLLRRQPPTPPSHLRRQPLTPVRFVCPPA
jgi:hypothetical protein